MMLSFILLLLISVFGRLATALGAADSLTPLCGDGARLSPPTSRGGGLRSSRRPAALGPPRPCLLPPVDCHRPFAPTGSLWDRWGVLGGCSPEADWLPPLTLAHRGSAPLWSAAFALDPRPPFRPPFPSPSKEP